MATPNHPDSARPISYFADRYDVSASTIRRMIANGELRAYRIGARSIRIDPADFERAMTPVSPIELAYMQAGGAA